MDLHVLHNKKLLQTHLVIRRNFPLTKQIVTLPVRGSIAKFLTGVKPLTLPTIQFFTGFKFHHPLPPALALKTMQIVLNIRKKTNPDSITVPCSTFTCRILEDKMWMVLGPCHLVLWLSYHCCKTF